ncbi:NAD(P)/FAD-dependent oxidoreductase [Rubinisphaera margarita]|uniref:NAD(P)/FAD-dependent oxidoreductase n=1 Tax=Rubinisphaera margarita TaxID=2909586 RepID=UPI001EE9667D|nr:FAD-dependent oxidoreductase [Rubinisphaera margarita]MCG6154432.1 FAD-binding oxidoreductase [Rubinisphaera margarita]
MSPGRYDVIIVGQGLAGSCLALRLLERHQRVLVLDRDEAVTSSKIAAGLMTPIVGQRFALSWRFTEFHSAALAFYSAIEQRTGRQLLWTRSYVRVFRDQKERDRCQTRLPNVAASLQARLLAPGADELRSSVAPWGGLFLPEVLQLDAAGFLQTTRERLEQTDSVRSVELQPDEPMQFEADAITLPRLGVTAGRLVYCGGAEDRCRPHFSSLRFLPAKGEILSLRTSRLESGRILSGGVWLAPATEGTFRLGATYDSQHLNQEPTESGKDWLLSRLRNMVGEQEAEVIGHQAAVRPALNDQKPILGLSPKCPQIGLFNGLGSKGSLQAPWLAAHFVAHLLDESPLIPEVRWREKA